MAMKQSTQKLKTFHSFCTEGMYQNRRPQCIRLTVTAKLETVFPANVIMFYLIVVDAVNARARPRIGARMSGAMDS